MRQVTLPRLLTQKQQRLFSSSNHFAKTIGTNRNRQLHFKSLIKNQGKKSLRATKTSQTRKSCWAVSVLQVSGVASGTQT